MKRETATDDDKMTVESNDDHEMVGEDTIEEVAFLIDQLKHPEPSVRVASYQSLVKIAKVLGPGRVRDELLPFITDSTDDSDDVLMVMAEQLGRLTRHVGGPKYAYSLLEPIENLAAVEESSVRERAVEAAVEVASAMDDESLVEHYVKFVLAMGNHDWFTARISACGLIAVALRRLPPKERVKLRDLFSQLARDDTAMVRRVAAANLGAVASQMSSSSSSVDEEVVKTFRLLAEDDQDSVRLQTVENCLALAGGDNVYSSEKGDDDERRMVVLPVLLATATDRSWRVRWSVASGFEQICRAMLPPTKKQKDHLELGKALCAAYCELLGDPEPEVRAAAAVSVASVAKVLDNPQAVLDLVIPRAEALAVDSSEQVRIALASVFGELAPVLGREATISSRVLSVLLSLLRDSSSEVRLKVISKLDPVHEVVGCELISQSLLPAIVELAADSKWRVRGAVIEHIPLVASQLGEQLFDDRLCSLCVTWLADDVAAVREASTRNLRVLAELFGPEWAWRVVLPRVLDMLTHHSYLRRITALRAVAALAEVVLSPSTRLFTDQLPLLLTPVVALCDDRVPNVRFNAAASLGTLAASLTDSDSQHPPASSSSDNKHAVLAALSSSIAPRLDRLAKDDPDTDVRDFAKLAHANVLDQLRAPQVV